MNEYLKSHQDKFKQVIDVFKKEIATLRTGRANPALLDGIFVKAYGTKTPLNGLANISVNDARSLVVVPWDKNILKDIEKAIVEANLGIGVINEGDKIRLTIPAMTEEIRRGLVKKLNEKLEKARIAIRQVREEIKSSIVAAFDDKQISEDDKFRFIKELDEAVSEYNEELKSIRDNKEAEIMKI